MKLRMHIVGSIAAFNLIYSVIYPVAGWYIWNPLKLRKFPAPSFLASISPIWLMRINAGEKRSYRVHEAHQKLGPIIRVGSATPTATRLRRRSSRILSTTGSPVTIIVQGRGTNLRAYNIPFSTGWRACIGRHIAIVELQILISTLVWRYDICLEREAQKLDVFNRFHANPGALPVRLTRLLE